MTAARSFDSFPVAAKVRDLIRRIAVREVEQQRPPDRHGKVISVDIANKTAMVQFPFDTAPVMVKLNFVQEIVVGATVRVTGQTGDRYVNVLVPPP